jgi:hypothetical protein
MSGNGIPCPCCGIRLSEVTDSRPAEGVIRRRRKCRCGFRFTTWEVPYDPRDLSLSVAAQELRDIADRLEPPEPRGVPIPRKAFAA